MDEIKIFTKIAEIDERLVKVEENLVTREDLNRVTTSLDKAMVILNRLDQEGIFSQEWIRRVEGEVERQSQEIKQLKQHLQIS